MRRTTFSDYSMRVIMYLGLQRGQLVIISDIAQAYLSQYSERLECVGAYECHD